MQLTNKRASARMVGLITCVGAYASAAHATVTLSVTSGFLIEGVSTDGSAAIGRVLGTPARGGVWHPGQAMEHLPMPAGITGGMGVKGISADGRYISGQVTNAGVAQGYRYDTLSNTFNLFGNIPGGLSQGPAIDGISGNGQWVLGSVFPGNSTTQSAAWNSATGTWRVHGVPLNISILSTVGSNYDGSFVIAQTAGTGTSRYAFTWSLQSGFQALSNYMGGQNSSTWDISDNGDVFVGSKGTTPTRWNRIGSSQSYSDTPIPGATGAAFATSADGSLIGGGAAVSTTQNVAFLWDQAHGTRLFSQVLSDAGVDVTGMTFWQVKGISGDGNVIAAHGFQNGNAVAFLVTVPAPGTLVMCGLGLAAARRRR